MNKDEILEKARKENKGKDIAGLEVQSKAHGIAGAGMLLLCATVNLIASLMFDCRGTFFQIMFCGYNAIFGIVRYIAGKRRGVVSDWNAVWLMFGLLMTGFGVEMVYVLFRDLKAGLV
ncbi:MAG: hypothetical protein J5753_00790 [Oscillospiraceae bacterium]|nr:hypothetical protein [Oscillospiraceae bacterium]